MALDEFLADTRLESKSKEYYSGKLRYTKRNGTTPCLVFEVVQQKREPILHYYEPQWYLSHRARKDFHLEVRDAFPGIPPAMTGSLSLK